MIFRKLLSILNPPKKAEPPLGLSESEIRALKDLAQTDEWQVYLTAIDRQSTLYGEQMLLQRDAAMLHECRGIVLGLRQAGTLIEWITQQETKPVERTDERSRSNGNHYGSSYFRRT